MAPQPQLRELKQQETEITVAVLSSQMEACREDIGDLKCVVKDIAGDVKTVVGKVGQLAEWKAHEEGLRQQQQVESKNGHKKVRREMIGLWITVLGGALAFALQLLFS